MQKTLDDSTLKEPLVLDVNYKFLLELLSTIDKCKLIELCHSFNIPTKGKDRYRLAVNLSKRIDTNKPMKILIYLESHTNNVNPNHSTN